MRNTDVEALHEWRTLLHQSLTAHNHLAGADTGLLRQAPQRQTLDTQLHHGLLLCLQPGKQKESKTETELN